MKLSKKPAIQTRCILLLGRAALSSAWLGLLLPAQGLTVGKASTAMLLSGKTKAVTLVVPGRFAKSEASSFTSLPFSRSKPVRVQHYYAPEFFKKGGKLTAIAFRPEGGTAFSAKAVALEIHAGQGPARVDRMSRNFARNRGKGWARYFGPKSIRLPAINRDKGPRDFQVRFVFDRPMLFDPKLGGLLIEFVVTKQPPGRYEFDLGGSCVSPRGVFGAPACRGSNGKKPIADSPTIGLSWGKPFLMRVRQLLPRAPALLILGSKTGGRWGNLQLPFSLAAFGAQGCHLNTDLVIVLGALASMSGEVLVSTFVPLNADFNGQWLLFQAMALDLAANRLGLTFSQGSKTQVCGPDAIARVVANKLEMPAGTLEYGLAPVTQFSFQ